LYFARMGEEFHDWMNAYSYAPWLHLATLADRARTGAPFAIASLVPGR
jgi:hypothetical protein